MRHGAVRRRHDENCTLTTGEQVLTAELVASSPISHAVAWLAPDGGAEVHWASEWSRGTSIQGATASFEVPIAAIRACIDCKLRVQAGSVGTQAHGTSYSEVRFAMAARDVVAKALQ